MEVLQRNGAKASPFVQNVGKKSIICAKASFLEGDIAI